MPNPFDGIRKTAFDVVTKTMGYDATWTPSGEEEVDPITGRVLLREPTEKDILSGVEYTPFSFICEFQQGVFPGLMEAVRDGTAEVITIEGVDYKTRFAETLFDGKNIVIWLEKFV